MTTPLAIIILTLAAARITRAITTDDVGAPIRRAITQAFVWFGYKVADRRYPKVGAGPTPEESHRDYERRAHAHHAIVERWLDHGDTLGTCPWCAGFWISVATVAAYFLLPTAVVLWMAAPWAMSYVVGLLDQTADRI